MTHVLLRQNLNLYVPEPKSGDIEDGAGADLIAFRQIFCNLECSNQGPETVRKT